MKNTVNGSICVIGQGRWGSSLLAALQASGADAVAVSRRQGPPVSQDILLQIQVFWLCVPDAQTIPVTRRLVAAVTRAGGSLRGRVVLHSSGVAGSDILLAAREAGAYVASVHPLMSFPSRQPVALAGVPFAVEAAGRLRSALFSLVRQIGGEPFAIQPAGKVFYHAAAVMASPLLVSLVTSAQETALLAGLSRNQARTLLQPIFEATLRNVFRHGAANSFSGPFARGDAETVSLHLDALRPHPLLLQVYRSLALHAMDALPVDGQRRMRRTLTANRTGQRAPARVGQ